MIHTERLALEPIAVEHAAALCEALAGEEVGRYIGGPEVTTLDAMVARIEYLTGGVEPAEWGECWLNWVAFAAELPDRPLVGRVEATVYTTRQPPVAEIAYVFSPQWSGRGYATEATAWMLDHLRDAHGVAVAYATVDPRNAASFRLLGRVGFTPSAVDTTTVGSYDPGDLVFERALS